MSSRDTESIAETVAGTLAEQMSAESESACHWANPEDVDHNAALENSKQAIMKDIYSNSHTI